MGDDCSVRIFSDTLMIYRSGLKLGTKRVGDLGSTKRSDICGTLSFFYILTDGLVIGHLQLVRDGHPMVDGEIDMKQ